MYHADTNYVYQFSTQYRYMMDTYIIHIQYTHTPHMANIQIREHICIEDTYTVCVWKKENESNGEK